MHLDTILVLSASDRWYDTGKRRERFSLSAFCDSKMGRGGADHRPGGEVLVFIHCLERHTFVKR